MKNSSQPVVVPCKGVSPTGRAVAEVVAELERLGAEIVRDPSAIGEDRDVIALDGCASGCSSRTLDAGGIEPALALDLSKPPAAGSVDAHGIATAALERLGDRRREPVRRSRSGFAVATAAMSRRQHTTDDYLLAIDRLGSAVVECGAVPEEAPTIAAHVSRLLDVTPVTVAQMVGQLEGDGLVRRSAGKSLVLTDAGRERADAATRRQRILECFVTEFLGHSVAEAFERAFMIGPSFDADAVERAFEALGRPERCPHGWLLDAAEAREESAGLMALPALAAGALARIVRIAEEDGESAELFAAAGLRLGDRVTDITDHEADGITLEVDGANGPLTLSADAARTVFVRPD